MIGIYQEIRSKKRLKNSQFLSAPKATVVRDGKECEVAVSSLVRDDIVVFFGRQSNLRRRDRYIGKCVA
ncbi:MAG: hypothetical protein L6V93_08920 [Clostridiales bacterium]|nr:MAG: hypothetical protein L6V93_08920 [Clostridiales bacterium]